jgi:hypothetical protein
MEVVVFSMMQGHLTLNGETLARGGFLHPSMVAVGEERPVSGNIFISRRAEPVNFDFQDLSQEMGQIQRGEFTGNVQDILSKFNTNLTGLQHLITRGITTATTNFPVRENLEAEAKILIPDETPLRNRLKRVPGAGLATAWKQMVNLGGGYAEGTVTTSATVVGAATVTVATGKHPFAAGDTILVDALGATPETKVILSVGADVNGNQEITVTTNWAAVHASGKDITKVNNLQPGYKHALRAFFAEGGAPQEHTTQYAAKTASYKLLGTYGTVTGFAQAAGMNFQNNLAIEKTNAIRNLMLNEEFALINGSDTAVYFPWGDGTNALGFNGFLNLITTANGTPTDQIQTAVGPLTTQHLDDQLTRLWAQGARGLWMYMSAQEILSMTHLAEASGSILRVMATSDGKGVLGIKVTGYVHPISGEIVDILPGRMMPSGTIMFGSDSLPDGTPTMDVDVLPQVQLPELAPNENIQGYTAQELAPTHTAPQVYGFIVTVYEVPRLKSAVHVAKSTGITSV